MGADGSDVVNIILLDITGTVVVVDTIDDIDTDADVDTIDDVAVFLIMD